MPTTKNDVPIEDRLAYLPSIVNALKTHFASHHRVAIRLDLITWRYGKISVRTTDKKKIRRERSPWTGYLPFGESQAGLGFPEESEK